MKSFLEIRNELRDIGKGKNKETYRLVFPIYRVDGEDLMKRGGKFYAIYNEDTHLWETNEGSVYRIINDKLMKYRNDHYKQDGYGTYRDEDGHSVLLDDLNNSENGRLISFTRWFASAPGSMSYHVLDSSITRIDEEVGMTDYRSKRLKYKIAPGSIDSYRRLMSFLYSPEDLAKIEWSIGSVLTGDSKEDDKILVLYGKPGSGKSTVLDLLKQLFDPYWVPFNASDIASKSDQFGLSMFRENPLVAIQDDGSLSKIDSPRINELISHKDTVINDKGVKRYSLKPLAKLFLATNELVDIHDTKLGIARRLMDVYPTGNRLPVNEYRKCVSNLKFELGAIAYHCIVVYKNMGKEYYVNYEPEKMIDKTNYLRNFLFDTMDDIGASEYHTRNELYARYKQYYEDSGLGYPPKRLVFGEQIKDYFDEYWPIKTIDGRTVRHVYRGFKNDLIKKEASVDIQQPTKTEVESKKENWLTFKPQKSRFDEIFANCPAQYDTTDPDHPLKYSWDRCKTRLSDLNTKQLHYVKVPDNVVMIDFDIKNDKGEKDAKANIEAAQQWPPTYGEFSKSGAGIHLYYFYTGDPEKLQSHYTPDIEIKINTGGRAIRRTAAKCNSLDISTITSGLPLKGVKKKMVSEEVIKSNAALHSFIQKCLRKEHHGATAPEVNFIYTKLEEAYDAGVHYDVSDMEEDIRNFAMNSTHQSKKCLDLVRKMHFKSDEAAPQTEPLNTKEKLCFYDVEVFPNLFVVCYKFQGTPMEKASVVKMINPNPADIQQLLTYKLVGFNNRRYDNHIIWARRMGYSDEHLYDLSQKIVGGKNNCFFADAYNASYTDIYDYSSTKQSLKKWEIQLGIHHQENHYRWDQSVPKEHWKEISDYCANDVLATEATFNATADDFIARETLAAAANKLCPSIHSTANDTTNTLTARIIFRGAKNPQSEFVYTDLSKEFPGYSYEKGEDGKMHNMYNGEDLGFGGFVYANPGIYGDVALLDIASMHPHSIVALNLFGPYTKNFEELMNTRIAVKHEEWDKAKKMLAGALAEFIPDDIKKGTDESKKLSKKLAKALKIAINAVYGLTSATFANPFKDPRNVNNIVALRGALFMATLRNKVMEMGYKVAHIKTDSIKIPWADQKIIDFVTDYGHQYGYDFEHEATFDRMCLLNGSTYICKVKEGEENDAGPGEWSGTGTEFNKKAMPYTFKKLFSHEDIEFKDLCTTKSVQTALYLDFNEGLPNVEEQEEVKRLRTVSSKEKISKKDVSLLEQYAGTSNDEIDKEIAKGHNYHFVGKVGLFTPVVAGAGGGTLLRETNTGGYSSANGANGYRWMESESVKNLKLESKIDYSYFDQIADDAKKDIQQFGDFDAFVSDDPIPKPQTGEEILDLYSDELPF